MSQQTTNYSASTGGTYYKRIAAPVPVHAKKPALGGLFGGEMSQTQQGSIITTSSIAPLPKKRTDFSDCTIRRSKSEKNFGRMYYWDNNRRTFVAWVESTKLTQHVMNEWFESCSPDEKQYWSQVYTDPIHLQTALDTIQEDTTTRVNVNTDLSAVTAAPLLKSKSLSLVSPIPLIPPTIAPSGVAVEGGFINHQQAMDQAALAIKDDQYKRLYMDLICFYLNRTISHGTCMLAMETSFFTSLKRLEDEKATEKQMDMEMMSITTENPPPQSS